MPLPDTVPPTGVFTVSTTGGTGMPVPERGMVQVGMVRSSVWIMRSAVFGPRVPGVKVTLTVQLRLLGGESDRGGGLSGFTGRGVRLEQVVPETVNRFASVPVMVKGAM